MTEVITTTPAQADDAIIRKSQLARARKLYLRCTAGARNGGGSDLVGRTLKALKVVGTKDLLSVDEIIDGLAKVDAGAAMEWAGAYLSGLMDNKANARRGVAYAQFVAAGGFAALCEALRTFSENRAWTFAETVRINGRQLTFSVDVRRELNDMFGLRLTNARRANFGHID
jgi:hypothetical protein